MKFNRLFFRKSKAGALSLVLGIAIIITALCLSMIHLGYFHRLSQIRDTGSFMINRRIASGFNYILSHANELRPHENYKTDLFENGRDSVEFMVKPWGVFQLASVFARQGKLSAHQTALIGCYPVGPVGSSALYLADKSRPLSIGGTSRIVGNAFLPESGAKKVVLNKIAYNGGKLIYGKTAYSKSNLPPLNPSLLHNLLQSLSATGNLVALDPAGQQSIAFHGNAVKHFQLARDEVLSGKFSGNMVIHSNHKIIIQKDAMLEDVIIQAPYVNIEAGFEGSVQVIARDTIVVGNRARLKYPSALIILKERGKGLIQLGRSSQVEGLIIVDGQTADLHERFLHLETESKLTGLAYADAMVIMKGNINGHLSCSKLLHATASSLYENHIMNARIERNLLPQAFIGADLWGDARVMGIVKWLE